MEALVDLIGLYILYKLVFDFIVPLVTTTSQVKKQVNDIQEKMREQNRQYKQQAQQSSFHRSGPSQKPISKEDYIDFEEIK